MAGHHQHQSYYTSHAIRPLVCATLNGMSRRDKQFPDQDAVSHKYWSEAHIKHRLRYHLVFVPKYRKRVLEGKVAAPLEQILRQSCEVNSRHLEEVIKAAL